jgi:iron complex outermembrane recepter protein
MCGSRTLTILACSVLTCACLIPDLSVAEASAASEFDITIAPGPLKAALDELTKQTHLQLLYPSDVIAGRFTRGVKRALTPQAALTALLKDTSLSTITDSSGAILIVKDVPEDKEDRTTKVTPPRESDGPPTGVPAPEPIDQVVVAGTAIHYRPAVGALGQKVSRDDMSAIGAGSLPDMLQSLPAIFGGGPNQDTYIGTEASGNIGLGTGVNLRGLGARETLVLIDGRRVALSGADGEFTDIMNIPTTAVESIEILPDAAAARYGADAVGGVVNFKLRSHFSGAESVISGGSGTRGDLGEYTVAQTIGNGWDSGHAVLSLEVYHRGALPAVDRRYAVSNLMPFGGGDFDFNESNPGNIIDPSTGETWAIPRGQNGQHLTASQLVPGTENVHDQYEGAQIIPSQQRWSVYASLQQSLGDCVKLFTDILAAHRVATETGTGTESQFFVPNSNPFYVNPTGGTAPVLVSYDFLQDMGPRVTQVDVDTLSATWGADFEWANAWTGEFYSTYSFETDRQLSTGLLNNDALAVALADPNPATAFNPFGDGSNSDPATVNALRESERFTVGSALRVLDASAAGTLQQLPAGDLKLQVGADLREEIFATQQSASLFTPASSRERSRAVTSAFAENVIPLIGGNGPVPGWSSAEMTVAARYEHYGQAGSSFTPKVEVLGSPTPNLALSGTWSQSARPPTLGDLDDSHNSVQVAPLPDRAAAGGTVNSLFLLGGNAAARAERSVSWTGGVAFAPPAVPGLSFDLTFFSTKIKDGLEQTSFTANALTDPNYSAIVTLNPTPQQIASICTHAIFLQGPTSECESSVGAIVDLRVRNLGAVLTRGIDFRESYRHETDYGEFRVALYGTRILEFAQAQTPQEPLVSVLNTPNSPLDLRLRLSFGWKYRRFALGVAGSITNSYWDAASIPERRVGSWTTLDTQLSYLITGDPARPLSATTTLELDAQNIFNSSPPFLNNQVTDIGYDQENANPYGRVLRLKIVKRW